MECGDPELGPQQVRNVPSPTPRVEPTQAPSKRELQTGAKPAKDALSSVQNRITDVLDVRSAELGNGQADCTTKVSLTTAVAQICSRLVEGFWLGNVILCVPVGVVETPAGPTSARAGRR